MKLTIKKKNLPTFLKVAWFSIWTLHVVIGEWKALSKAPSCTVWWGCVAGGWGGRDCELRGPSEGGAVALWEQPSAMWLSSMSRAGQSGMQEQELLGVSGSKQGCTNYICGWDLIRESTLELRTLKWAALQTQDKLSQCTLTIGL